MLAESIGHASVERAVDSIDGEEPLFMAIEPRERKAIRNYPSEFTEWILYG